MKIAQVVCAFPPYAGGIGNSAQTIGQLLGATYEVANFTPNNTRPWLKYGHGAFLPQLLWRLRRFDYVYLHYPFFGTAEVVWLFKLLHPKTKLIIHYHMDVKNLSWLAKALSLPSRLIRSSLLSRADLIVSASLDYIAHSQIKNFYAAHPEKFREIPFGVDLKKFQPRFVNQDGSSGLIAKAKEIVSYINDKFIKRDRLNLLFVGALDKAHYFKGINNLLQALAKIKARNWRLNIVGEGDLRSEYETLSAKLGLEKMVKFSGKLAGPELIRAYQDADLFILPSINSNEAFGIGLIEALACGVPVLASDLAGVRSVFQDGVEGLLAKTGDVKDLQAKLEYIMNNEEKRRVMAKNARRLAEIKYGLEDLARALNKLFV